jgi:hypothetical protein
MKRSSKSTLLAGAAVVALSVTAAPMAQAQSNFDGPYIGLGAGYHHFDTGSIDDHFGACCNTITEITTPSRSTDGPFGDVFAGYGLTLGGPFYVGVEIDGSYSGANTKFSVFNPRIGVTEGKAKISATWGAGVGLRLGYLVTPDILGYVRGGGGWQNFNGNFNTINGFDQPHVNTSRFAEGVRAGGGIDFSLASWTGEPLFGRVEYDHTWYGQTHFGGPGPFGDGIAGTGSTIFNFHPHDDRVMLGIAWRFAPPPPPPPPPVAAAPPPPPAPPPPAPPKQFVVYFEFDKSDLTPEGAKVVQDAADAYKQTGSARIAVTGYTDLAGTQRYNLGLSKRRADTVHAALVRDGVPDGVIAEAWRGKENPAVPTPDGVREPRNRRVEIVE